MSQAAPKIGLISLGCPKALVDSERILTQLRAAGYALSSEAHDAEAVIVNTCGFLDSAKAESLQAISEAMQDNGKVIVTGCLGKEAETIRERFPGVLSITGPQQYEAVTAAVAEAVPHSHDPFVDLVPEQGIKLTPRHYAYLKISEGCNHACRFCIIPSLRGKLASRPANHVLYEAERLARAGVNELLLISQDTSAYGIDSKHAESTWHGRPVKARLTELCEALAELNLWLRLHYVYPYPHVDELIPLMQDGRVLPYLDIPFQHASPRVLKAMRRPAHQDKTLARLQRWREACPEIAVRSTFIVGFPGETEAEFEELLDWLQAAQLDRVGCFRYEPVRGAAANGLPDPLPEEVKDARWHRFMEVARGISAKKLQAKIGSIQPVIVDGEDEDGRLVARSYADAPEIDGNVYLASDEDIAPGTILAAGITAADDYDLYGEPVELDAAA